MIPIRDDNPRTSVPWVTWTLIAANLGVFLLEFLAGPYGMRSIVYQFGLLPARVTGLLEGGVPAYHPAVWLPFLTCMFLHGGFLHVAGNMLYLHIFGDNIEDSLGHGRFLAFYLACGVAASLAHTLVYPGSQVPVVGASGAVAGVLGAYALLFPRSRVLTLIPLFVFVQFLEIPALYLLGFWFVMQFFNGFLALGPEGMAGGGVAWWAHVAGFLVGLAMVRILPLRRRPRTLHY